MKVLLAAKIFLAVVAIVGSIFGLLYWSISKLLNIDGKIG